MSRNGAAIKVIDYATALLTLPRQIISNANSLIKVSFGCSEIQYAQRALDLTIISEQRRRRGNASYEAAPEEVDPERRAHGNQSRVTDLAINFITNTRIFKDHRTEEDRRAGHPPFGHVETTDLDPFPIFVSWTGLIVPDIAFEDPDNIQPIRLVGQPMMMNIGPADPAMETMGERRMDQMFASEPANLAILLSDDPTTRLTPDRTERQWGWFPPSADARVSVGDVRQRLQDLRDGPGNTEPLQEELWRLMRDGRRITDRLHEMTSDRGGQSSSVAALRQMFREDRFDPPRVYDQTDPWARSRHQSW